MKDVFLIYNTSCFYEIVILTYFMNVSGCDMVFCSPDGNSVRTMEGFSVHADMSLKDLDKKQIRSFIIPGGEIAEVDSEETKRCLQELRERKVLLAGICAGVDVLEHAGILRNVRTVYSADEDLVCDDAVITARANAYVDFAIEAAKRLDLFVSQEDLQETVDFWKYFKRAE